MGGRGYHSNLGWVSTSTGRLWRSTGCPSPRTVPSPLGPLGGEGGERSEPGEGVAETTTVRNYAGQDTRIMLLYYLTWQGVAKLDRRMVVVVPFGAVEQHSHHLPLGTDAILTEAIAQRLEQRMPEQVLVLPTVWLGCSRHHMDFAGSLTAEIETFGRVGEDLVGSMAAWLPSLCSAQRPRWQHQQDFSAGRKASLPQRSAAQSRGNYLLAPN